MKSLIDNMIRSLPKYNVKQPSTKKTITFRPFVVREEKTLYMSNETGTHEDFLSTLGNVIDSCFELKTEAKNLPIFDIEYFFLKLRCKSLGEFANPTIICPYTGEKIKIELNLDEIEPSYSKDHTNEIKLDGSIKIKMKYPTLEYFIEAERNIKDYYELIIDCIESIETKDELIESKNTSRDQIQEFVDVLKKDQFEKLISFIKTMPRIEKKIEYTTTDGKTREILLKGIKDFFL
jgi:hypothetical protein